MIKSPGTDEGEGTMDSCRAARPDLWKRKCKPSPAVVNKKVNKAQRMNLGTVVTRWRVVLDFIGP